MSRLLPALMIAASAVGLPLPIAYGQTTPGGPGDSALPDGAVLRLGGQRLRHPSAVTGLAWAADARAVVSAAEDGARVWDAATGRELRRWPQRGAGALAASPDGRTLAAGGADGVVRLWDLARGQPQGEWRAVRAPVLALAFSRDGARLAAAGGAEGLGNGDDAVRVWDVRDPAHVREALDLRVPPNGAYAVAFSPDGSVLATGGGARGTAPGDTAVRLWDAATGKELRRLTGHPGWVYGLSFSADSRLLASACTQQAVVWEIATGRQALRLYGGFDRVQFAPAGTLVAVGGSRPAVWDAATGRKLWQAEREVGPSNRLAFSPDGRWLATGGRDGQVRLWDAATGRGSPAGDGHRGAVQAVAFSPDGSLIATGGADQTIRLWGAATGARLRVTGLPGGQTHWGSDVAGLCFTPDGRALAAGQTDRKVRLWDVATGRLRRELIGHGNYIKDLAMDPGGRLLASASHDGTLRLWDVATGAESRTLVPAEGDRGEVVIDAVAVSPDGKLLAATVVAERHAVAAGRALARDPIQVWELPSGRRVRAFGPKDAAPTHLAFGPGGALFAVTAQGVQQWDAATGELVREFRGRPQPHWSDRSPLAVSADGKLLATGEGPDVRLWDVTTGQPLRTFRGHAQAVLGLAFAPDGRRLASASADGTALVWDLAAAGRGGPAPAGGALAPREVDCCWADLGGRDPARADEALRRLVRAGDAAVPALAARVAAVPRPPDTPVPLLVADLGHARPEVREAAARALRRYGAAAEPDLYGALRGPLPPAVRREVEQTLEAVAESPVDPDDLRALRAVQALERIGTPAAERVLADWRGGGPAAAADARLALDRLRARRRLEPVRVLTDDELAEQTRHRAGSRPPRPLPRHSGAVTALAFSPDGTRLASASGDDAVLVCDADTGAVVARLRGHDRGVNGLAFFPDGRRLATTGNDHTVRLWDVATGRVVWTGEGHTAPVLCVAFARRGATVATGGADGKLGLWDAATGRRLSLTPTPAERVTALAVTPDGRAVLSGGVRTEQANLRGVLTYAQPAPVCLWGVPGGERLRQLGVRGSSLALTPDGRTLVAGGLFRLLVKDHHGWAFIQSGDTSFVQETTSYWWDVLGDCEVRRTKDTGALAAAGDGVVLTGGRDRSGGGVGWGTNSFGGGPDGDATVRLWDARTGQGVLRAANKSATAVALSPDGGRLAWGEQEGGVVLWDLRPAGPPRAPADPAGLWEELAAADAARAYQAGWELAATPDRAVALLGERLKPAATAHDGHYRELVAALDSPKFAVREAASAELRRLGGAAEPILEQALAGGLSAEARLRAGTRLRELRAAEPDREQLRRLRAVGVLRRVGTPAARALLQDLSGGSPFDPLTREASRALADPPAGPGDR